MRSWEKPLIYVLLGVVMIWTLSPIFWILNVSLKTGLEVYEIFSVKFSFDNYLKLLGVKFQDYLINTAYLSFAATGFSLVLAIPAAFSLTKLHLAKRIRLSFLIWTLFAKTIPPIVLIIPLYIMFSRFRLLDNLTTVALSYQIYTLPFAIWMLMGFFSAIPREVEEAAKIDGANPTTILVRIMLPLVMPGVIATAIFALIISWNEFLYAVTLLQSRRNFTAPLVIAGYISEWGIRWGEMAAAGVVSSLPMLLFTGYVQRYLILGFMRR